MQETEKKLKEIEGKLQTESESHEETKTQLE